MRLGLRNVLHLRVGPDKVVPVVLHVRAADLEWCGMGVVLTDLIPRLKPIIALRLAGVEALRPSDVLTLDEIPLSGSMTVATVKFAPTRQVTGVSHVFQRTRHVPLPPQRGILPASGRTSGHIAAAAAKSEAKRPRASAEVGNRDGEGDDLFIVEETSRSPKRKKLLPHPGAEPLPPAAPSSSTSSSSSVLAVSASAAPSGSALGSALGSAPRSAPAAGSGGKFTPMRLSSRCLIIRVFPVPQPDVP